MACDCYKRITSNTGEKKNKMVSCMKLPCSKSAEISALISGICSTKDSKAQACFYSAKQHKDVNWQSVISAMSFSAHISHNGLGSNTDHKVFFSSHNPRGRVL